MKTLPILWKRLVSEGSTCPRCSTTQQNLTAALTTLEAVLRPLGIRPVLESQALDAATFRAAPAESNRIWVGGLPMETWLGAHAGNSPCCEVCGDLPCRTVEVDGQAHEVIPAELIVKAGLLAAARLVGPGVAATAGPCCSQGGRCG